MSYDEDIDVLEAIERETTALFEQANRLVEALAARAGMGVTDLRCLSVLCRQGPLTARRLASLTGLTSRAAGEVIDRLERQGHIVRLPDPDGHRILVHADRGAHRARIEPALRDLREAWYPLIRHSSDDFALVAGLLSESRRLTSLVGVICQRPDAFTL